MDASSDYGKSLPARGADDLVRFVATQLPPQHSTQVAQIMAVSEVNPAESMYKDRFDSLRVAYDLRLDSLTRKVRRVVYR